MKRSFLNSDKALLTSMVQADNPERIKELMKKSSSLGAEAFGMQFERMKKEHRTIENYKELFAFAGDKPTYVTNYRCAKNEGKTDEELSQELIILAECGATLCDVMGDCFDKQPDEFTTDINAVEKQMELIDVLHQKAAEVLMSTHICKFTPAERVLEIALEHQRRGADISKIVVGADNMEEQIENLRIINLLKNTLKIPFLFLSEGENRILRRISGEIGNCMYLCVCEHDEFSTVDQPLIENVRAIIENI